MDVLKEYHLYRKKMFKLMSIAVHNAIVIYVKVDNDLFLCFLKFYEDQNMLC